MVAMRAKLSAESKFRLLIAEYSSESLNAVAGALRLDGIEIITASDSRTAFEQFAQLHPQIVLLDALMPEVDGAHLLDRMVAADPGVDVILVTPHYSPDSAVE